MTDSPALRKDLRLIEAKTNFIESRRLSAGQAEDSSSPDPEASPNGQGSYCPLPPLWRFPWQQSEEPRPARRLSFVSGTLAIPYLRQAKSLVLVIMMALVPGMAGVARAQQEVAPDRFDRPSLYAPTRNVASRKLQRVKKKIADHRSGLTARAQRAR
jgi:hypothetical protein